MVSDLKKWLSLTLTSTPFVSFGFAYYKRVINVIQTTSPGDPSIAKLWQQAQVINSDLVDVSGTSLNASCTPPLADHGLV